MEIVRTVVAGTLESSDIMITLSDNAGGGIEIELKSNVEKQFGQSIRRLIAETLAELGVTSAKVSAVDKGALDCAVKARVKTAVFRAVDGAEISWKA